MNVEKNVGSTDRMVRIIAGVVLLLLAIFMLAGITQIIAGLLGVIALVTGIVNFCPLYQLFKLNTRDK